MDPFSVLNEDQQGNYEYLKAFRSQERAYIYRSLDQQGDTAFNDWILAHTKNVHAYLTREFGNNRDARAVAHALIEARKLRAALQRSQPPQPPGSQQNPDARNTHTASSSTTRRGESVPVAPAAYGLATAQSLPTTSMETLTAQMSSSAIDPSYEYRAAQQRGTSAALQALQLPRSPPEPQASAVPYNWSSSPSYRSTSSSVPAENTSSHGSVVSPPVISQRIPPRTSSLPDNEPLASQALASLNPQQRACLNAQLETIDQERRREEVDRAIADPHIMQALLQAGAARLQASQSQGKPSRRQEGKKREDDTSHRRRRG